ncbi:hypothetical protein J3A83DRAFT_4084492 [Scleroderma citrinum]
MSRAKICPFLIICSIIIPLSLLHTFLRVIADQDLHWKEYTAYAISPHQHMRSQQD